MKIFLIPLVLFFGLVIFLAIGLNRDPREIPSPLIGQPAPAFSLKQLDTDAMLGPEQLRGKVWMLNVWASWCVACRDEHPVWVAFARDQSVPIIGLNYKEIQPQETELAQLSPDEKLQAARVRAKQWLARHGGNPYLASVMDMDGKVGIQYGVYGVPETYVIDRQGVIRFKHVGAVTPALLQKTVMPLIRQLEAS
ncbi:MAG: DsbE family thiol:disulfide interchange protein [Alphaproteobacteria bacterium]|nr:DsbE family thiol:disulfide interchange protein [Alphaproteobacteria bacterium]